MSDKKAVKESIAQYCKTLKLSSNFAEQAMIQNGSTNQEYLDTLLGDEIQFRKEKRITKYLNTAGFPRFYEPQKFRTDDIIFQGGATFDNLLDVEFYDKGNNVIMYGGSGTGKTMLSILIGIAACKKDIPVKFYRTAGFINLFAESKAKGTLTKFKKKLDNSAHILILDEFGYVPYDKVGAQLFFDYLSEIHEQENRSVILSTNLEFSQWVNVLYDERMTTALIGRLTHHVELLLFQGTNNRLKESSLNEAISKLSHKEAKRQQ